LADDCAAGTCAATSSSTAAAEGEPDGSRGPEQRVPRVVDALVQRQPVVVARGEHPRRDGEGAHEGDEQGPGETAAGFRERLDALALRPLDRASIRRTSFRALRRTKASRR